MTHIVAEDVFTPCTYPEETYIEREAGNLGLTYEDCLRMALGNKGTLISVTGPSKTGKTMLCEKLIPSDRRVLMTGTEFDEGIDFWSAIAKKIGMSMYGELEESYEVPTPAKSQGGSFKKVFVTHKDAVVNYFIENKMVLILDDFHYATKENQKAAAYYLKDVIRIGFKAIIISLPHRADDTIRLNPDLAGRMDCIELAPWSNEDLRKISKIGFEKLKINLPVELENKMLSESLSSPSLMQRICLYTARVVDMNSDTKITPEYLMKGLTLANINIGYNTAVNFIKEGPSSRGQKRKLYNIYGSEEGDLYEILLHIIAENPPYTQLTLDEIKKRADKIISGVAFEPKIAKSDGNKASKVSLKSALVNTHLRLNESNDFRHLLEWRDNCLFVLDPEFLFYLRWSNWDNGVGRKGRAE